MKNESWKFSARSLNNLVGVHPSLVHFAHVMLHHSPHDFGVIDGVRTLAEQKVYKDNGASNTLDSMHLRRNFEDGTLEVAGAFDILVYIGTKGRWEFPLYTRIYREAIIPASKETGILVTWGGIWRHPRADGGHIELLRTSYPSEVIK